MLRLLIALLTLTCCSSPQADPPGSWQTLSSRDQGEGPIIRYPLYSVWVPDGWTREDPPSTDSNADTTLPIATFRFEDATVYVHSFPYTAMDQRIPPMAQVTRWQKQLDVTQETTLRIEPVSHGGFAGFRLDAQGDRAGSPHRIIGWAMQLFPEHYRNLHLERSLQERHYYTQLRSDYTIKAVGSPETLERMRDALELFGSRFALIEEVPTRV